MKIYFDDIAIKQKFFISGGYMDMYSQGLFVILGDNGCGHTLLLKNIFSNEQNESLSMVFVDQNNESILTDKTVLQNISMSDDAERNEQVKKELEYLKLGSLLKRSASKMSGGEKRLVNLLRGFFSDKDILLIDEPTNDLDYVTVRMVKNIIHKLSLSKLLLIVTHDDRIVEIADGIYEIRDGKINQRKVVTREKKETVDNVIRNNDCFEEKKNNVKFIKSLFRYDFLSFLFSVILIVVFVYQTINFVNIDKTVKNKIPDNQVNLYNALSVSISSEVLLNGVFPIFAIEMISEKDLVSRISKLNAVNEYIKNRHNKIIFDLDIDSTSEYTVYPFEFFDPVNKQTYFTLDLVLQTYYGTDWDVTAVDTTELFEMPFEKTYIKNETKIKISKEQFLSCAKTLSEAKKEDGRRKYETVCTLIVFEGAYTFADFCKTEDMRRLSQGSGLICSNEVIEAIASARVLKMTIDNILTILLAIFIIEIVDSLFFVFNMILNKNKIFVLKNYAYSEETVRNKMQSVINNRYPKLLSVLLFLIFNIVMVIKIPFDIINFYFTIFLAFFMAINYRCRNEIIGLAVKNYYKWYTR